ncbi:n-glycanase [Fusarium mexicanum]|uniref:N-glycanase n=1 Tax=Fusarium mexicanum TaxID=751941 RepID=A0A8H5MZU2_9HYPO|nr:n-glycanase [Fusarium mexicanum]
MPFSRILSLQDDKWNNPEDSIGTFIGYLRGGRYRCWEAVGPARLAFSELSPDIKNCLETSSIPPADIVSWSVYMVGHTEENAAPKILICSTDSKTRKKMRKLIRDSCRVEGRLTATPSYIRLPEQVTFKKYDNRFYGHIVAGGPGARIAYLVPAEEISRDIQARLSVGLMWMPQQEEQGQHSTDGFLSPTSKSNNGSSNNPGLSHPDLYSNTRQDTMTVETMMKEGPQTRCPLETGQLFQPLHPDLNHAIKTQDRLLR